MGLKRNCPFTTQITRNILDRFAGHSGVPWRQRPQLPIVLNLLQ